MKAYQTTALDCSPAIQRILIVDDAKVIRSALSELLEAEGYAVACAADGREALRSLAQRPFDLLVTDWRMPVLDGCELIRELRRAEKDIPVILLSLEVEDLPPDIRGEIHRAVAKADVAFELLPAVRSALASPRLCHKA